MHIKPSTTSSGDKKKVVGTNVTMSAMRSNLSVTRDAAVLDLCEEEPGGGVEDCKHLASNNSIVLYSIYSIVKESVV